MNKLVGHLKDVDFLIRRSDFLFRRSEVVVIPRRWGRVEQQRRLPVG